MPFTVLTAFAKRNDFSKEKEYDESRGKIVRGEVYLGSDGEILDE